MLKSNFISRSESVMPTTCSVLVLLQTEMASSKMCLYVEQISLLQCVCLTVM